MQCIVSHGGHDWKCCEVSFSHKALLMETFQRCCFLLKLRAKWRPSSKMGVVWARTPVAGRQKIETGHFTRLAWFGIVTFHRCKNKKEFHVSLSVHLKQLYQLIIKIPLHHAIRKSHFTLSRLHKCNSHNLQISWIPRGSRERDAGLAGRLLSASSLSPALLASQLLLLW